MGLPTENLNIRYLAWTVDSDPLMWTDVLRKKASLSKKRASALARSIAVVGLPAAVFNNQSAKFSLSST